MNCQSTNCEGIAEPGTCFCLACQKKIHDARVVALGKAWNGDSDGWRDISPPKKYFGATWATLSATLQKQIMPFVEGTADLLTFVGPPGTGKSWTSWATAGVFLVDHPQWYKNTRREHIFTNWYAINEAARDSRLFGEAGASSREWMDKLAMAELVVIDEFATARPYEAEFMGVMGVIHNRFDNGRPTILITTKSNQELTESLGEAMVSRINSGIVVRMQGRDRRIKT